MAHAARRRRTAEEARELILEAAQRRLAEGGPEAVRLQEIAADAGLSHPTILHHFGSREGLLEALLQRAMDDLRRDLLQALRTDGVVSVSELLDRVANTLSERGHARLLAWRLLSRRVPEEVARERMLSQLASAAHERRSAAWRAAGRPEPSREETHFVVWLTAVALLGDAIGGPLLSRSLGMEDDASDRFRAWLAELLDARLGEANDSD